MDWVWLGGGGGGGLVVVAVAVGCVGNLLGGGFGCVDGGGWMRVLILVGLMVVVVVVVVAMSCVGNLLGSINYIILLCINIILMSRIGK